MYTILGKNKLLYGSCLIKIEASQVARFIILKKYEKNHKIPLNNVYYNAIRRIVNMATCAENNAVAGFVGPLRVTLQFVYENIKRLRKKNILFIGNEIGSAAVYPQIKWLCENKINVDVIISRRSKEFIMLEETIKSIGAKVYIFTDDGSYVLRSLVIDKIKSLTEKGNRYDEIIAIAPMLMMMYFISIISDYINVKDIVSLNDLIIGGSGEYGACKVTVAQESKFDR